MSVPWFFRVVVSSVVASEFTTVTAAMGASNGLGVHRALSCEGMSVYL